MRKLTAVPGLIAGLVLLSVPAVSSAGVFLSVGFAPPALQVYAQPLCPTDGYLWTPGYWGYRDAAYYWIPGAWMAPPQAGFLWTPGYWGFSEGLYSFNAGYWGPTVGFYGGVNYGFGYGGRGFDGGRWQGGHFAYNTAVSRVNTTVIHNTYNQNVTDNRSRTSFNGGPGGISARPNAAEASTARAHNQPAAAPAARERASVNTPAARPAANAPANNRSAEPQSRMAARPSPNAAKPNEGPAANARVAPQENREVNHAAPNRPSAPPQRPQETHAAAPQRAAPAARPQAEAHAAAPQRSAPAARPAEGKEERR